jgi:hypothetical protein
MWSLCLVFTLIADEPLKLGLGQPWYEADKSAVQTLEGILDYQPGTGRIGTVAAYTPFRFLRKLDDKVEQYSLHCPGQEALLAASVGQRVSIEGKVLTTGEGDQKRLTLWPGKMTILGIAPANVFTEILPLARTAGFQANSVRIGSDIASFVMHSPKDVGKALGIDEAQAYNHLLKLFGIKSIDWKTHMVIYIGPTRTTSYTQRKLEITKLEVHERGATVYWKNEEPLKVNAAPSTDTVLVPRVDGEITFKQVPNGKKAETKPEDERLIPRAPVK